MKQRPWQIRRQFVETSDAQRRWDQAYHCLLQWTHDAQQHQAPAPASPVARSGGRQ